MLVVPFFDLPGRVSGFYVVGRDGNPETDFVFRRANLGSPGNQYTPGAFEAGLAFHPGVPESSGDWKDCVFAVRDPLLALRLQVEHFRGSLRPLPLAIWMDSSAMPGAVHGRRAVRTINAWQALGHRKIVFWTPKIDVATIRQAAAVNGMISKVGPVNATPQELQHYAKKWVPRDLFRIIQRKARPWQEALAQEMEAMSDAKAAEFILQLQACGEDYERIAYRCGRRVQERVTGVFADQGLGRSVRMNGYTVIEKDDRWSIHGGRIKQPVVISDAVLHVDDVVVHHRLDRTYYKGRVLCQGRTVPFCEPEQRVRQNTFAWMADLLRQNGMDGLTSKASWSRAAVCIAQRFHGPVVQDGLDRIGWDTKRRQFVLPKYTIGPGGKVEPVDSYVFPEAAPGRPLLPPGPLSAKELACVADDPYVAALFWATIACVAANITAPACHRKPGGIILQGTGAAAVGTAVAAALGCLEKRVDNETAVGRVLEQERAHGWPILIRPGKRLASEARELLMESPAKGHRNCIVALADPMPETEAVQAGWTLVTGMTPALLAPAAQQAAAKILPAYLKDLCERRLKMNLWDDGSLGSWVQDVLRDLSRFAERLGAAPQAVLAARQVLRPGPVESRGSGRGKRVVRAQGVATAVA